MRSKMKLFRNSIMAIYPNWI